MPKGLTYAPPSRRWFATGNLTEDGKRMFASRDWKSGEKAEYVLQVGAQKAEEEEDDGERVHPL